MKKFIEELKRRNVIKATIAYLVVAWIIIQVALAVLPTFGAPDWVIQAIIIVMVVGLPVWIIVSWIYDITPEGIEKTAEASEKHIRREITNKRLNVFIIASLSIAVIVLTLKITNVFTDSGKQYTIAVLPFNNIQVDKDSESLSESFAYDVYTYISQMSKLQVSDFYSSMRYKNTDKTNAEIGQELNVNYLLRGTARQSGNTLKITIDLIDARTNNKDWTKTYDEVFEENTLDIQQLVSHKIVQELNIKLSPQDEKTLERKPTENVEAQHLFTKGSEFAVKREGGFSNNESKENLEKSIVYFQKAIELDSTYAEAYAEMAHSYYLLPLFSDYDYEEYHKIAVSYLDKATKLNSNLFRVYAVKAMMIQNEDWKKGGEYFEKSLELNPNDATVHMQYKIHLERFRPVPDYEKALEHMRIAHELESFVPQKTSQFLYVLLNNGLFEEAEELLNKYGFIFPEESLRIKKANLKVYKSKDWKEYIRFYEAEIEKDPNNAELYKVLGSAYDDILNDDNYFLKYAKKAYDLDSTNSAYARFYFNALTESKKFSAANKLMQSKNYNSVSNKKQLLFSLWYYYYHQENYKKAQEVLKDSLWGTSQEFYTAQLLTHAQLGDRKYIESEFKEYYYRDSQKAFVYAVLKEKDSMYHYLEKGSDNSIFILRNLINGRREFDPYRKEERYKALLRKTYLPITHWNE